MLTTLLRRLGLASAVPDDHEVVAPRPEFVAEPLGTPVRPAPEYLGYLDELSEQHMFGWVYDRAAPDRRLECEAVLPQTGEIVARVRADQFGYGLSRAGIGDGAHAFWTQFPRPLSQAERAQVAVRVVGEDYAPVVSSLLIPRYEPLLHVAMDIVDNCNLRCPFCLYDYAETRTTHVMSSETLDSALRFLPYTRDGQFWFSCLHEPTLHPQLMAFVDRVPLEYRKKLFFTTNLAKRMPESYFDWLANNGMHNVNISIESRDPAIYERMRKGARFRIFQENWDKLVAALDRAPQPTRVRYIAMAYTSNLRELPELTRYLLQERRGWQVEIRYTFDAPFIPRAFRDAEFLDAADWAWLAAELAGFPSDRVELTRPPAIMPPADPAIDDNTQADGTVLPGRYLFRLSWDGSVEVKATLASSRHDSPVDRVIDRFNVHDVPDPAGYFSKMPNDTSPDGFGSRRN